MRLFLTCVALGATLAYPATAQSIDLNDAVGSVKVGAYQIFCWRHDGVEVEFIASNEIDDIGYARTYGGKPYIIVNPSVFRNYTTRVQFWWIGHECAHHALAPGLNSEMAADCYSAKAMRNRNAMREEDISTLAQELANLRGSSWGHLPGPLRVGLIVDCFYDREHRYSELSDFPRNLDTSSGMYFLKVD